MALKQNANSQKFENPDDENEGEQTTQLSGAERMKAAAAERAAAAEKAAEAKPASTSKEVATTKPNANAIVAAAPLIDPLEALENAFPVEYDTLRNLIVTNGNVMDRETNKTLGDIIGLELLSFQKQFVVSPGVDGDEAKEHVRYSDDGVTTSKGENCAEYLQKLKDSGYEDAKMSERSVICGSLFDIGDKGRKALPELQDSLVQISLPPTSKAAFQRYRMDQAFKIRKGLLEGAGADRVKIECSLVTKGTMTWTVASFSRWTD